jgi:hypothetical protein
VLGLGCTGYGCCYSCHPRRLEKGEMDTTTWSILVLVERRVNIAIYLQGSHALQSKQIIEFDTYFDHELAIVVRVNCQYDEGV